MSAFKHLPVMLEECLEGLAVKDGGIYFDGTVGGGGHSYEILKRSSPTGRLIATDLDDDALSAAGERLKEFKDRAVLVKSDYKNFGQVFSDCNIEEIDGAILDFGVSSWQLDNRERGFSYLGGNAPLDMRMDITQSLNAETVVNQYSQKDIAKILKEYGEEKFASSIANEIVKRRNIKPIRTCGELTDLIESVIPKKFQQNGPVARKSFQALRIAVNGELKGLYECIIGLTRKIKKGGRIVILTFHSLEDRIVKQAFRYLELDCICDKNLPVCICGKTQEIKIITKKPIVASVKEMSLNPRSKCAKLRIAEKII